MKIEKTILKMTSLLLIIGLSFSGIFGVGETMAYFNDKEISLNNTYAAGTLDFSLRSGQGGFVSKMKVENMRPGNRTTRTIQIHQEGSLPFKYTIRTEKISGDDDFCNVLELEAKLRGEVKYPTVSDENSLMSLDFLPVDMVDPPGIDTWQFRILLPNGASDDLQNKTCEFKFVFEGQQYGGENCQENSFNDMEEIENELTSSNWTENQMKVDYPNGGEAWYIGRHYNILWTTGDFDNCDGKLDINIWYSVDSGANWANIVKNTKNNGSYRWRVPLFLYDEDGEMYFTASAKAIIKIVATCSNNPTITVWDMSDEDFCPPIDYDLLTQEEIDVLESLGLFNNSDFVEEDNIFDDISDVDEEFEPEDEVDESSKEDGEEDEKKDGENLYDTDNNNEEETENLELEIGEEENIDEIEAEEIEKAEEIENLDESSKESEDNTNNSIQEHEVNSDNGNDENDSAGESETENSNEDEDAKDEEFVLTPKEEILPDDNDDINDDRDDDDNGGENNENENSLDKNSVDCVQAVK